MMGFDFKDAGDAAGQSDLGDAAALSCRPERQSRRCEPAVDKVAARVAKVQGPAEISWNSAAGALGSGPRAGRLDRMATNMFRDCIVSLVDLNNIGALLAKRKGHGVRVMRDLHQLVANRAPMLKSHEEVCFFQDSVLLLAFVNDKEGSYGRVMADVALLKADIDTLHRCHAVSVKGQSFPSPSHLRSSIQRPRSVYLAASSLAFSNCFKIEDGLKTHKADWYIDARIIRRIQTRDADASEVLNLHPRGIRRTIQMFRGSFSVDSSLGTIEP